MTMNRLRYGAGLLALGLLMLTAQGALAKGPPDKITIRGPGIQGEASVTDRTMTSPLGLAEFENVAQGAIAPPAVGADYDITRYYQSNNGGYVAFDQVRYYPMPGGQPGYVFYVGIVNGSGPYDGKWY